MSERIEGLKSLLAVDPTNAFARYGLAMEYARAGQLEEAVAEFAALLARDPDYAAAYYQLGQALEELGRTAEARQVYQRGIEIHTRQGNQHARRELELVLEMPA